MNKKNFRRLWEILPGGVVWLSFILPVVLSFFAPAVVATYIIVFDAYWLYKAILFGLHLLWGHRRLKQTMRQDWQTRLERVEPNALVPDWRQIYQALIYATYKESLETLENSIEAVLASTFPKNKIIFVLATEQRDKENAAKISRLLQQKYGHKFFKFLVTCHPDSIAGENKAKGANVTWAAKKLRLFLDEKKIPYENVIVSTADADARPHRQYLSYLAYRYVLEPNRLRRSFQPIMLYSNNIWQAPAFSRVVAFGNSFWQLIESTRPWRLINFATHAMSMKTLVEMNYWAVEVVNEDSRQFWRAYFTFSGDHQVVPLFIPIYMDAVLAASYWGTIKNQYRQKQRWAYGAEHFPYVVTESIKNKAIPFWDKAIKIYRLFEGNYSWATASIYIAGVAWLPWFFGPGFKDTVLGINMMGLIRTLMICTWVGIIISVYVSLLLLPPRPPQYRRRKFIEMVLQWVIVPIQAIVFSSIPAIDAQTRLMLGKYLTFKVTEKKAV